MARHEPPLFEPVDDRHHGRTLDTQDPGEGGLVEVRVPVDQRQNAELTGRYLVFGHGPHEIVEHRGLCPAQVVAEQLVQYPVVDGRGGPGRRA